MENPQLMQISKDVKIIKFAVRKVSSEEKPKSMKSFTGTLEGFKNQNIHSHGRLYEELKYVSHGSQQPSQ